MKVVVPLMAGGIIAVDQLQHLLEDSRLPGEREIPTKELFNYVASAHLLNRVPHKDEKTGSQSE